MSSDLKLPPLKPGEITMGQMKEANERLSLRIAQKIYDEWPNLIMEGYDVERAAKIINLWMPFPFAIPFLDGEELDLIPPPRKSVPADHHAPHDPTDPRIPDEQVMYPQRVHVTITKHGKFWGELGKDSESYETYLTSKVLDPIEERIDKHGETEGGVTVDGISYEFRVTVKETERWTR